MIVPEIFYEDRVGGPLTSAFVEDGVVKFSSGGWIIEAEKIYTSYYDERQWLFRAWEHRDPLEL